MTTVTCPKCGGTELSEPKLINFNGLHSFIGALIFGIIGFFFGIIGAIPGIAIGIMCGYRFGKKPAYRICMNCGKQVMLK